MTCPCERCWIFHGLRSFHFWSGRKLFCIFVIITFILFRYKIIKNYLPYNKIGMSVRGLVGLLHDRNPFSTFLFLVFDHLRRCLWLCPGMVKLYGYITYTYQVSLFPFLYPLQYCLFMEQDMYSFSCRDPFVYFSFLLPLICIACVC